MKCPHCGGEVSVSASAPRWRREEDGTIRFSVTSDGLKSTNGVTTEVAVLPGSLWSDDGRTMKNVCVEAKRRKFSELNAEVARLIREQFTDEEIEKMGISLLVVMHAPIDDSVSDPFILGADRIDDGRWLSAGDFDPHRRWDCGSAFAFAVPAK